MFADDARQLSRRVAIHGLVRDETTRALYLLRASMLRFDAWIMGMEGTETIGRRWREEKR